MTRTILYLSAVLAVLLLCPPRNASAFAGAGPGYGPGCREPGIFGCIAGLDLTEAQKTALESLRTETRARIIALREELRQLEIPEALFAENIDTAALEDLLNRKKSINAEIIEIRHEAMISAVQLLTPQQREAMRTIKNDRLYYQGRGGFGRRGLGRLPDCPRW